MNLDPELFWDLSLSEYEVKCDGYFLRQEREWLHTRYLAQFLYSIATKKVKDPRKMVPSTFDKDDPNYVAESDVPLITKEEVLEFERKWLKTDRQNTIQEPDDDEPIEQKQ